MLIATARDLVAASPLLAPAAVQHPLAGVARVRSLALGRAALADLRQRRDAVLAEFPLGTARTAKLLLTRFEPFPANLRLDVVERGIVRHPALPDHVYFMGGVEGDPRSRVFLVAAPDQVRGFVATDGMLYPFGPDGAGGHATWAQRDVDPTVYPAPELFCANDLTPQTIVPPQARAVPDPGLAAPFVGAVTLREAEVAIETDSELYAKFGSEAGALDYLAALVAASSAIYERDAGVRLRFSYIRLWSGADPWSGTSPTATLDEVRTYWNDPRPRAHDLRQVGAGRRRLHRRPLQPDLRVRRVAGLRQHVACADVGPARAGARARPQLRQRPLALLRPADRPLLQPGERLLQRPGRQVAGLDHELLPPPLRRHEQHRLRLRRRRQRRDAGADRTGHVPRVGQRAVR
jgi:hypothetical protein